MQDDERLNGLTPAHRELEDALRGLSPAAVSISRDRVMFQAGVMLGKRSAHRWRSATALLVLLNVGLLALAVRSPRDMSRPQIAQGPTSQSLHEEPGDPVVDELPEPLPTWRASRAAVSPGSAKSTEAYVSLRDDVLRRGVSALPVSSAPLHAERPVTVDQLLETTPRPPEPASPWSPLRHYLLSGERL